MALALWHGIRLVYYSSVPNKWGRVRQCKYHNTTKQVLTSVKIVLISTFFFLFVYTSTFLNIFLWNLIKGGDGPNKKRGSDKNLKN